MRPLRAAGRDGQSSAEFIIVLPVFVAIVFAVMFFCYAAYQRADVDYQLSSLAGELPAGWESMDGEALVRDLLLDGSQLDPSSLEVTSALVSVDRVQDVRQGGAMASALDAGVTRTDQQRVEVEADVSYTYSDVLSFGHEVTYRRHLERSYTTYTDFEVS